MFPTPFVDMTWTVPLKVYLIQFHKRDLRWELVVSSEHSLTLSERKFPFSGYSFILGEY